MVLLKTILLLSTIKLSTVPILVLFHTHPIKTFQFAIFRVWSSQHPCYNIQQIFQFCISSILYVTNCWSYSRNKPSWVFTHLVKSNSLFILSKMKSTMVSKVKLLIFKIQPIKTFLFVIWGTWYSQYQCYPSYLPHNQYQNQGKFKNKKKTTQKYLLW